jgi:hypothetical protein
MRIRYETSAFILWSTGCAEQTIKSCSGRQVWVHAFYIALLSTELPPAAIDHRASRSFYGSPWELDSS